MIKNIFKREEMKQNVKDQLTSLYPQEGKNILDITLLNMSENILLWQMDYINNIKLYFYTDRNYKIVFSGQIFAYASPFSNQCALVKEINGDTEKIATNIIDLSQKKIVQVPLEEMESMDTYHIRSGNIAMLGNNGHWGSYVYNGEETSFRKDIPFIWDALEFSKNGENVGVGLRYYQTILNTDLKNKWKPNKIEMKIKIMEILKENAYNTALYRQFLIQTYKNQLPCLEIYPYENLETSLTPQMEETFIHNFHDLYGYESETPIINNCINHANIVEVGNIEEYTRVRGKTLK